MGFKENIAMNCERAIGLVEKKRDEKLSFSERIGLWVHLGYCGFCALFFEQSQILDQSSKSFSEKITNGQKAYPLDPMRKAALTQAFEKEMKAPKFPDGV